MRLTDQSVVSPFQEGVAALGIGRPISLKRILFCVGALVLLALAAVALNWLFSWFMNTAASPLQEVFSTLAQVAVQAVERIRDAFSIFYR
jgi:hypothetical protein